MKLDASLERLFHRNLHIIKLDLEPMRVLMELLGNPHQQLICLHIAGTNGKGSVCATLASILQVQGYRTGLYTSPHLVKFNERIQIDGQPIDDQALSAYIDEVEVAAAKLIGLGHRDVTFFEFSTALALLYFQRTGVQIAVIETGMGGRLDATNIITPAISIITSIGLEHTQYLGDSLAAIAGEKAGIIKPGRPVIMGPLQEEARDVIITYARERGSPLFVAEEQISVTISSVSWESQTLKVDSEQTAYGTIKSPLPGKHQASNIAIVIAAAECLNNIVGVPVAEDAIKAGIARTQWLARGQLLLKDPPIILDGAHNPDAAAALAGWTKKAAGKKPLGLIVGFLSDKDPAAFIRCFTGRVRRIWVVPIQSDRAMSPQVVAQKLSFVPHLEISSGLNVALTAARTWAAEEGGVIIITGSLYLAGEVLASGIDYNVP